MTAEGRRSAPPTMSRPRLRIRAKFFLVLGVLIPAIGAVAVVGVRELGHMEREARTLYIDNIQISHLAAHLGESLADAAQVELQLVLTTNEADRARLNAQLDLDVAPHVEEDTARASAGELGQRLEPREHDEIADLGRALDEMVARREAERRRREARRGGLFNDRA